MQYSKVEICGIDTSNLPVLNRAQMSELLEKIKQGDKAAQEKFIYCNLRLVLSVVQRFTHRGEQLDDIFQVGCIGLIKSIRNFDISQNVRFSTYAVPMIIGEIRRYLRDNNSIRVSRSMRDLAYKAMQARELLANRLNRDPSLEEIAKELDKTVEETGAALDSIMEPVSIFEPVFHDGGDAVYVVDQIGDDKNTDGKWLEHLALKQAMQQLDGREKNIIFMRYFKGKTQMEVANEISISQAQVSRLEKGALDRIKKQL